MQQFLADQIDQLDLALDQLAVRDRNFDRFAIMLIDNVAELVLHQHARDKQDYEVVWRRLGEPQFNARLLNNALGAHFDAKIKFAVASNLVPKSTGGSIQRLHTFRNSAYHQGQRHEGILHSLAIFYFLNCCDLLAAYSPNFWGWSSRDQIPFRARKYLGTSDSRSALLGANAEVFGEAWRRLRAVAKSLDMPLVSDLATDMEETVNDIDRSIEFLVENLPGKSRSRDAVVVESQVSALAYSEGGEEYAKSQGYRGKSPSALLKWLEKSYPWPVVKDPIPAWRKRLAAVRSEKDNHRALEKYCSFMSSTQGVRTAIDNHAIELDGYIQHQIDVARGK